MSNKLGKDTGSLMNYVYGDIKPTTPEVGMGATLLMWSDRRAYTIHKVDGKKLWASSDIATRTDENGPFTESQDYSYENKDQNNPERWSLFTLRKDGRWHMGTSLSGNILSIGSRMEYTDPTF